jgi:hypothetical protein
MALPGKAGRGMQGLNAGVSGNPTLLDELTGCAGAVVGMVESVDGPRKNQKVTLRMGAPDDLLIVNSNFGVAVGDCVAVAPPGSVVGDNVVEHPKLLDEKMLGWTNPAANCAVTLNKFDLLPGDSVPSERPEKKKKAVAVDAMGNEIIEEGMESLYVAKVKLTKEEKMALKAEKAKQKAIKAGTWVEKETELETASKKDIKAARVRAKKRRQEGEDQIDTDHELEEAGMCR